MVSFLTKKYLKTIFLHLLLNNAPVAEASGKIRCISQFKYALGTDSNFSYKTVLRNNMETHGLSTISQNYNSSTITVYDASCTTAEEYAAKLKGVVLYYELAEPIEYPLPKVTNNYTCSNYGVEEFDGCVPCNANNLYYMRSLAGETRNFLDRLMDRLGASDITVAADRIIAAIQSHDVVEETSSTE